MQPQMAIDLLKEQVDELNNALRWRKWDGVSEFPDEGRYCIVAWEDDNVEDGRTQFDIGRLNRNDDWIIRGRRCLTVIAWIYIPPMEEE